mgnify:CR=1 FL=1
MIKISKKGSYIVIFVAVVIVIFLMIYFVSFIKTITIFNQTKNDIPAGEIYGDIKIGQTFIAEYDNLTGIKVLLATYDRKNIGNFIFHLKSNIQSKEDEFIYHGDLNKVKDNKYFNFNFPAIRNSKGKKYYFYLESPHAQFGNAITIWSNTLDSYKDGEKIVNGVVSEGDLVFLTTYDSGVINNFSIFLDKITKNKPFPLEKKLFYIILISLFILCCSLFITILVKFFFDY